MSNEFPKFPEIPVEITQYNGAQGAISVWLVKNQIHDNGEPDYTCLIGYLADPFCPECVLDDMEANPVDINWRQEIRDAMYSANRVDDRIEHTAPTAQAAIGGAIVEWYESWYKETL